MARFFASSICNRRRGRRCISSGWIDHRHPRPRSVVAVDPRRRRRVGPGGTGGGCVSIDQQQKHVFHPSTAGGKKEKITKDRENSEIIPLCAQGRERGVLIRVLCALLSTTTKRDIPSPAKKRENVIINTCHYFVGIFFPLPSRGVLPVRLLLC